jgi:hypothetical protein
VSRIPPARTPNDHVRTHLKALLDEAKHQAAEAPAPAQMFFSGMLAGLAASVEIHDGGTAEKSMELMVQRLSAAIGQAYLDGKLPPQPPTTDGPAEDVDRQLTREQEIRGVQGWMAMDIHQALGRDTNGGEPYQGHRSWSDWWAELCAEVRKLAPASAVLAHHTDKDLNRVIDLHGRWTQAGPPPFGTSLSRWWDARLIELREAILGPDPKDPS